jgi:hypothetical protein
MKDYLFALILGRDILILSLRWKQPHPASQARPREGLDRRSVQTTKQPLGDRDCSTMALLFVQVACDFTVTKRSIYSFTHAEADTYAYLGAGLDTTPT